MSRWSPRIFLDASSEEPIYLQIAQAVARDIEKGRLRSGDALPGYRALAQALGVNRNTVLAAFHELVAQGWILSRPGEGTVVADALPGGLPVGGRSGEGAKAPAAPVSAALLRAEDAPHLLEAGSGAPDPRLLPTAALSRAYREAARHLQRAKDAREDPQGHPRLRAALAGLLSDLRGVVADPSRLFITRGAQASMNLVGQALSRRGPIAVESPGANAAWEILRQTGARLLPVPVDRDGLDVDALARLGRQQPLSAVLTSPSRQYPTLVPLASERRRALLALAAERDFLVIESDPDPEFQFSGQPLPALASKDVERVVYVGTLSRVFSPGVRLGLVRAPASLLSELQRLRQTSGESDVLLELAMAGLIEDGELQRHINRTRKIYQGRRDALAASLARHLGGAVAFTPPEGGLAFWLHARAGVDVDAWAVAARARGAVFRPGRDFMFEREPLRALRLGFSSHAEPALDDLAQRLARALPPEPG